jgi:hypothetical protein
MIFSNYLVSPPPNPQPELSRILNLGITGHAWGTPATLALTSSAGMTSHSTIWTFAADVSGNTIGAAMQTRIKSFMKPDYSDAWYVQDEPKEADFHAIAVVTEYLKDATPNALIYSNIGFEDVSPDFLNTYLNTAKPDMLMTDTYPYFTSSKPAWYPENPKWFNIAMTVRKAALDRGIPYFCWLEAFQSEPSTGSDAGTVPFSFRLPSESEMRAEAYTCLTMGYTGLSWFGYDLADPRTCDFLVDWTTRMPNKSYYWVQSIDREVQKLGVYLRFLKSTDVRFVPNKGNSTPEGLTNWSKGAGGDKYIRDIELSAPAHASPLDRARDKQDALIGFFTDKKGHEYFMLENLYRSPDLSASAATSSVTVSFDGGRLPVPGVVYRLDRTTGKSVAVRLVNGSQLRDRLPGGTADLYSYMPFNLAAM